MTAPATPAAPDAAEAAPDSFLAGVVAACRPGATGWRVRPPVDPADIWVAAQHGDATVRAQGWKLHVSATVVSAAAVLRRALPELVAEPLAFKVAATPAALGILNRGDGGASQVGKFITVYPSDDAQAVRLAARLDAATRGLAGPVVPSDRRLHARSLVSYRFGAFDAPLMQTPMGDVVAALVAPNGALEPDRREPAYRAPAWAVDPFAAAGIIEPPRPRLTIAGRYAILSVLAQSPRASVYLALHRGAGGAVVLKRARPGALVQADGRDARDRLRHEAAVLRALAPLRGIPAVRELIEDGDDLVLVLDDLGGETLDARITRLKDEGRLLTAREVIELGCAVAEILGTVHARGHVHRDVKSANILLDTDGRPCLIDFELAHRLDGAAIPPPAGTVGYMSPQQLAGGRPAVVDDVYALGAVLYLAATGAEPSQAPRDVPLTARPIALLNPAIGPALVGVIGRCLDSEPARRFASMAAVATALRACAGGDPAEPARRAAGDTHRPSPKRPYRRLAEKLGRTIVRSALPAPGGDGLAWETTHPAGGGGRRARDVNTGAAGTLLALSELAHTFDDSALREAVAGGARWLAAAPPFLGPALAGLYVGDAGVGAALLRAGEALGDARLVAAAAERGRQVAALPYRSPDLFAGTAGRLRFHLMLWHAAGDTAQLRAAEAAGERLLAEARDPDETGEARWLIPEEYSGLGGAALLGYSHGAAGIADALLDLAAVSCDGRLRATARDAARWLARLAVPVPDGGLAWPKEEGGPPTAALWCHGAAGIGRFFLHAARVDLLPGAADLAERAARTVARGTRWAGPTRCHGLAGNIEILLEVAHATGDRAYRTAAHELGTCLLAFATEREGALLWPSEQPAVFTPDYMVGYAGVARSLLLLDADAWWTEPLDAGAATAAPAGGASHAPPRGVLTAARASP